ncbi:hypothetical protein [Natronorubrum sp. FCH18a]|uniref:hypothetical protein n=1 Tax=Natronorubrum sp. FCH18a TaxID=3447018 RepID=UPI003F519270
MTIKSTLSDIRKEMKKDGLDLLEQVLVLITGGILGGKGLSLANSDLPILYEFGAYMVLFAIGMFVLGTTHFVISFQRVVNSEREEN